MEPKSSLRTVLYQYCTAPLEEVFPHFRMGASIFLCGLVIIYAGSQLLLPSLAQEIVVLVGLIVIGIGLIMAMLAQIRMLIGRVLSFFTSE
ncbi:MAG: hypothetical protein ACJAZJ_000083 [Candidatus Endobugula sp.]|jgi:hypothetical protein